MGSTTVHDYLHNNYRNQQQKIKSTSKQKQSTKTVSIEEFHKVILALESIVRLPLLLLFFVINHGIKDIKQYCKQQQLQKPTMNDRTDA
jgi:hypothetical protein